MAFIPKTERKFYHLNLHDDADKLEYERILNDPSCKIISRTEQNQSESHFEQDYSTTKSELHIYLEVEQCTF